jgi:hypothetical protein
MQRGVAEDRAFTAARTEDGEEKRRCGHTADGDTDDDCDCDGVNAPSSSTLKTECTEDCTAPRDTAF